MDTKTCESLRADIGMYLDGCGWAERAESKPNIMNSSRNSTGGSNLI